MPRRASLGETRNEHQLATVQHFKRYNGILVAESAADLATKLNETLAAIVQGTTEPPSSEDLLQSPTVMKMIQFVKEFVSFYKENYILNDFSLLSISSNNRDKDTEILLNSMLEVIKLVK